MSIADVRGKAALVIGGTRGIGRVIVERFAEPGAKVRLTGRDAGMASRLVTSLSETYGQPVSGAALDVTDRARMREVVERFAPLREDPAILVYNAGISPVYASAEKVDEGDWDAIIATNLTGAFVVPRGVEHQPVAGEEVRRRDHDDLYRSRLCGMEIQSAAGDGARALCASGREKDPLDFALTNLTPDGKLCL